MKRIIKRPLGVILLLSVGVTTFTSCSLKVDSIIENENTFSEHHQVNDIENDLLDEDYYVSRKDDNTYEPHGEYNKGAVLVKSKDFKKEMLGNLDYTDCTPVYEGSSWHLIKLNGDCETVEAYNYLKDLDIFEAVDYDYIMSGDGETESIDISGNIESGNQTEYLETHGIFDGWAYQKSKEVSIGGNPDVVVAIIDTGVDYNHIDLRNNVWTNAGEIPNNGMDDDNNGYIDDYIGWNFVSNNNNPMDDNGHGTHVAGIVAAENNNVGTIGLAFNCKVMCLKAGNSSGYFNNSEIAAAVQYAYMNGASVINMSFGGSALSIVVQDVLENAYSQCVLVAASGNDYGCIELGQIVYPAVLPWVIGVDSCNASGTFCSSFGNCDLQNKNNLEYEVFACGEQIISTFPNNKFASMSGTSMAAPVVSSIAAILRSTYPDREIYSNKYIQSQIVSTGDIHPMCIKYHFPHDQTVVNLYNALTKYPTPEVSLYRSYIFDTESFSSKNNGDGTIDAGELIHIGFDLFNYGGVASEVNIKIDANRNGDSDISDPYVEIVKDSIELDSIGTYSIKEGNSVFDFANNVVDMDNSFIVKIDSNIPNDYKIDFNYTITYRNGLDDKDIRVYSYSNKVSFIAYNGIKLSGIIEEDTIFDNVNKYIISDDLIIPKDVTVTFTEGCQIIFYDENNGYVDTTFNSPKITVYGELLFDGNENNMISLSPSEQYWDFAWFIETPSAGSVTFNYCNITNFSIDTFEIENIKCYNCNILGDSPEHEFIRYYFKGSNRKIPLSFSVSEINNCVIDFRSGGRIISPVIKNSIIYLGGYASVRTHISKVYGYNMTISKYYNSDGVLYDESEFTDIDSFYSSIDNNIFIRTNDNVDVDVSIDLDCYNLRYSYDEYRWNETDNTFDVTSTKADFGLLNLTNNVFISEYKISKLQGSITIHLPDKIYSGCDTTGNIFVGDLRKYSQYLVSPYLDYTGKQLLINFDDNINHSDDVLAPYIQDISIFDNESNKTSVVGNEAVTVVITFSKDISKLIDDDFKLYYGSTYPYKDYSIIGSLSDDGLKWTGSFRVKAFIEGGTNFFSLANYTNDSKWIERIVDNSNSFSFDISTTSALSMNLQAIGEDDGIHLNWLQDDYDTLMGYNVYRSDERDGNYVRLNTSVISSDENTFVDYDAEPGRTYWYTFTVVLSDMSESSPAGKVSCISKDTIPPNIYHTPVNQGYLNNNLVISCTASDNIGVSSVTLFYRTKGQLEWKTLSMLKQNNKYSATIFGSDLTLEGLDYYIVANDGTNTFSKGNSENPYNVIIKDASSISRLGDVDGDGVITTKDALMIIQSINGDLLLTDDQFKRADLNKDNVLSSVEALRVLQYINGNVTTLSM